MSIEIHTFASAGHLPLINRAHVNRYRYDREKTKDFGQDTESPFLSLHSESLTVVVMRYVSMSLKDGLVFFDF